SRDSAQTSDYARSTASRRAPGARLPRAMTAAARGTMCRRALRCAARCSVAQPPRQLCAARDDLRGVVGKPRADPLGPLVEGQRRPADAPDRATPHEAAGVDEAHVVE